MINKKLLTSTGIITTIIYLGLASVSYAVPVPTSSAGGSGGGSTGTPTGGPGHASGGSLGGNNNGGSTYPPLADPPRGGMADGGTLGTGTADTGGDESEDGPSFREWCNGRCVLVIRERDRDGNITGRTFRRI